MNLTRTMLFFSVFFAGFVTIQSHVIRRNAPTQSRDIVCYYTNWAQYRTSPARFVPADIDPYLCTHIVYAFARIKGDNTLTTVEWNDVTNMRLVTGLKRQNADLKVLIAVGGWNHEANSSPFSRMTRSAETRRVFINSVMAFLKQFDFDGIDLDWEFPTQRHGTVADRRQFTLLCKELKETFDSFTEKRYLLTAAVLANPGYIDESYEVTELAKYLDSLHLMAYDLAGSWAGQLGQHTATHGKGLSVENSLRAWLNAEFPAEKIDLGIATYGRSFTMANPNNNQVGNPSTGPGERGQYTGENGFLSYYEICDSISNHGATEYYDGIREVPYATTGNQWVGYDNEESVIVKAQLIKDYGLKGAMFWSLDLDDFAGSFCRRGRYPLINTMKKDLAVDSSSNGVADKGSEENKYDSNSDDASSSNNDAERRTSNYYNSGDASTDNSNNGGDTSNDNSNDDAAKSTSNSNNDADTSTDNSDNDGDARTTSSNNDAATSTTNSYNDSDATTSSSNNDDNENSSNSDSNINVATQCKGKGRFPVFEGWCRDRCTPQYCPTSHCIYECS